MYVTLSNVENLGMHVAAVSAYYPAAKIQVTVGFLSSLHARKLIFSTSTTSFILAISYKKRALEVVQQNWRMLRMLRMLRTRRVSGLFNNHQFQECKQAPNPLSIREVRELTLHDTSTLQSNSRRETWIHPSL